ncbi:MAG: selenoprotein B glycine/betaine/sarcosine/D-proline reductase [Chloroflexi bacterium]|nr:selenoprotein B glycine/betaine/sarcosine/D-proline reductase [Chloroflexota bacterium]
MVRWETLNADEQRVIGGAKLPTFESRPWVTGPPLSKRRVAIISTAGLHRRDNRPFTRQPGDYYRIIPGNIEANDLLMSHVSLGFDRTGFQQDWNVAFPIDRLRELANEGVIGSVASFHYSFMGADDPLNWEQQARQLAAIMKNEHIDAVLLVPV